MVGPLPSLSICIGHIKSYIWALNPADWIPCGSSSSCPTASNWVCLLGDFHAEKVHACEETSEHIDSWLLDLILTASMKEFCSKTRIVSIFWYSTGLASWLLNELLEINIMWCVCILYFEGAGTAWKSGCGINASSVLLSSPDGAPDSTCAIQEWTL